MFSLFAQAFIWLYLKISHSNADDDNLKRIREAPNLVLVILEYITYPAS